MLQLLPLLLLVCLYAHICMRAQILANLALVITEEESPAIRDWLTWRDIFHFVDILCCCAILFPIVWSIKQVCCVCGRPDAVWARLYL